MREENEYIVFLTREKGYWGNDRYVLTSKHYGIFPITDSFEVIQHSDVEDFNSFGIKSEEMDKVGLVTFAFDDIAMDSYNSMIQSEKDSLETSKISVSEDDYTRRMNDLDYRDKAIEAASLHQQSYLDLYKEILQKENLKEPDIKTRYFH